MLLLHHGAFDPDMTGGWHGPSNGGCRVQAADMIREWRTVRGYDAPDVRLLFCRKGQMRAEAGEEGIVRRPSAGWGLLRRGARFITVRPQPTLA